MGFALIAWAGPSAAQAQPRAPAAAQAAAVDTLTVSKLVWSSIAALDHANQTGNYSVLRDLGAPSFQTANSAATLAGLFQPLRGQQVDLASALIVAPSYDFPPAIIHGGLLRVRGRFPLRPTVIGFDLLFQNIAGQWKIFGMAVVPLSGQPPPSPQPKG